MTLAPEAPTPAATDVAGRGSLEISHTVVRKIVEHAADQVPGTLRGARRVAGLELGETGSSAKVAVGAEVVDVRLELALRYPGSIPTLVAEVREHVGAEVARITGLGMRTFDVTVTGLYTEPTTRLA